MYLFACLLSNSKANYNLSTSKNKTLTHAHTKTKQGNVYHLDSKHLIGAVMRSMMRWEHIHICICI
jgi:uncharacterized protein YcgI (DUF1989 family)